MRITWYGHAAFLIETGGLRIILDPFKSPDSGGYEPINDGADVVVVSHENDRYHSHLGQIAPPFEVLRGLDFPAEGQEYGGITFKSVHVYETDDRRPEDEVTILHFRVEGMRVVFLGDLGHSLSVEELEPLRNAEILMVAAGGPPTIGFAEIPGLIDEIGPRLILPMHYKTPRINLKIEPVERFLECVPAIEVERPGTTSIDLALDTLPGTRRIVILEHAR